MKKKVTSIFRVLLMTVLCTMLTAQTVSAAELPSVTVPVEISLSGTLPSTPEEFVVKLVADDASYPMPEGAKDGVYTMIMTGAGTKNFPAIVYDKLGVYTYKIYQEPGSNEKCTYDTAKYELTVYITNAEDGSGLEATAVLYPETDGDKLPGAEFKNVYETEPEPTPEPPAPEVPQTPNPGPKTGDSAQFLLYLTLAGISAAVLVTMIFHRKKIDRQNNAGN